jgi:hypothetical protein
MRSKRLVGEDGGAFGDGVEVEAQAEVAEVAQEVIDEQRTAALGSQGGEVVEVLVAEAEGFQPLERKLQPRGDGVTALEGQAAEEEMEDAFLLGLAGLPVGGGHGELIEVGLEGRHGRLMIVDG